MHPLNGNSMNDVDNKVLEIIETKPGQKAKDIAAHLGLDRQVVNSSLVIGHDLAPELGWCHGSKDLRTVGFKRVLCKKVCGAILLQIASPDLPTMSNAKAVPFV